MATRGEREAAKKNNATHAHILSELMSRQENKTCADCPERGPRWASWNLGIFLCIKCSGIHRNLGVHISKVRSTNLDTWRPEWVECMQKWGNKRANEEWEYHLPSSQSRPDGSNTSVLEQFIRQKYERAKWKRKASDPPISDEPAIQVLTEPEEQVTSKRDQRAEKERKKEAKRIASGMKKPTAVQVPVVAPAPVMVVAASMVSDPVKTTTNDSVDLLGDLFSAPTPTTSGNGDQDFGDFMSNANVQQQNGSQQQQTAQQHQQSSSNANIMQLFNTTAAPPMMGMHGMMQPGMQMMNPMQQQGMMQQQTMQQQGMMGHQGMMQQQPSMMQQPMMQQGYSMPNMQQLNMNGQGTQSGGTTLNSNLWN